MWYYIVLLFALYIYAQYGAPQKRELYILGAIAAVLVVVAGFEAASYQQKEHFADTDNNLDTLLQMFGISKSADNSYMLSGDSSNVNENLSKILQGLVLYYSCFSKSSYNNNSVEWKNISPFFQEDQPQCPDVKYADTHFKFTTQPSFSRDLGFSIGSNMITGPQSHMIGINGPDSFSIAMLIQFTSLVAGEKEFVLYQQFANTPNNNGIKLAVGSTVLAGTTASTVVANLTLTINNQVIPAQLSGISSITIDTQQVYLVVLSKKSNTVSLAWYKNVSNMSTTTSSRDLLINSVLVDEANNKSLQFSNKPLLINSNQNLNGRIYSLAVYNRDLTIDQQDTLFHHYKSEFTKTNSVVKDFVDQINNLKSALEKSKACPYTSAVCTKCTNVQDWTDMQSVAISANRDCLDAVHAFCTSKPTDPKCVCWNPSNSVSKTIQCQNFVNIFSSAPQCTIDKIDPKLLEKIKKENNFCSCQDIDAIRDAVLGSSSSNVSVPVTNSIPKPQLPKLLDDKNYSIDYDSINVYELYAQDTKLPESSFSEKLSNWMST